MSPGKMLTVKSNQWGLDFYHFLSKKRRWEIHYLVSLNIDQYKNQLFYSDDGFDFGSHSGGVNNRDIETTGILKVVTENSGGIPPLASSNFAIGFSKSNKTGRGIRYEVGFRDIRRTQKLKHNEWKLSLNHAEYERGANGNITDVIYNLSENNHFPLYIGGIYVNVQYTFRPFRSRFDDPNYTRKKIHLLPKIFRKKRAKKQ